MKTAMLTSARFALGCAFAANSAVEQEIILAAIMIAIYIYKRFMHINTCSIEAE